MKTDYLCLSTDASYYFSFFHNVNF